MAAFASFHGVVRSIEDFRTTAQEPDGCFKLMSVTGRSRNLVNFVVSPCTYFVDSETGRIGDMVVGFYDPNAPTPMIYPPQYRAVVMTKVTGSRVVSVDDFNSRLISSDGTLQLRVVRSTRILLTNGQLFTGSLQNRDLVVVYPPSFQNVPARLIGIPEQVTPTQIIVLCRNTGMGDCS